MPATSTASILHAMLTMAEQQLHALLGQLILAQPLHHSNGLAEQMSTNSEPSLIGQKLSLQMPAAHANLSDMVGAYKTCNVFSK